MQFAYILHMCILHICSMHINSMYAINEFAYVPMRNLHICSMLVKIYATYVLHISIFVRDVSAINRLCICL